MVHAITAASHTISDTAVNVVGRPFSQSLATLLGSVAPSNGFSSPHWISGRLATLLGLTFKEGSRGTVVTFEREDKTGQLVPIASSVEPRVVGVGENDHRCTEKPQTASTLLFNADQTLRPDLFSLRFCAQQKVPVGLSGRVITGKAFAVLRQAMIDHALTSPLWVSLATAQLIGAVDPRAPLPPSAVMVDTSAGSLVMVNGMHLREPSLLMAVARSAADPLDGITGATVVGPVAVILKLAMLRADAEGDPRWLCEDFFRDCGLSFDDLLAEIGSLAAAPSDATSLLTVDPVSHSRWIPYFLAAHTASLASALAISWQRAHSCAVGARPAPLGPARLPPTLQGPEVDDTLTKPASMFRSAACDSNEGTPPDPVRFGAPLSTPAAAPPSSGDSVSSSNLPPPNTITLDLSGSDPQFIAFETSYSFGGGGRRETVTLSLYNGAVKVDLSAFGVTTVMK